MQMSQSQWVQPVVRHVSYALAHVPGLVEHGSKPMRELSTRPELAADLRRSLRTFSSAVSYLPHQVYIGGASVDDLWDAPEPWYQHDVPSADRFAAFGELMPEEEFYGLLRLADDFDLVSLTESFARDATERLSAHPFLSRWLDGREVEGVPDAAVQERIDKGALPLRQRDGTLIGCIRGDHELDEALQAPVLLENLAAKASGFVALWHLIQKSGLDPNDVGYVIGCGEEAVGDRYQRGGGNLAKAIAEMAGCGETTGSDTKAFCCAPVHSLIIGSALVASGVYRHVVVVGGGSLAKLGMKFLGHLRREMPVIEDVLAAVAVWIGPDDGENPVLRLDAVGSQPVRAGMQHQEILGNLVMKPLEKLNLGLGDVDRYATELHNPEATVPSGSGDVPRVNYRTIAAVGVRAGMWERDRIAAFERSHGMRGFSPTQGHIASAIPYLGHGWEALREGSLQRILLLAKGSLFLGRLTHMSDGVSMVLERNPAAR